MLKTSPLTTSPLTAKVFQQCAPVKVRELRVGNDVIAEYAANLVHVGTVAGSKAECWKSAEKLCAAPVLEFDHAYRGAVE